MKPRSSRTRMFLFGFFGVAILVLTWTFIRARTAKKDFESLFIGLPTSHIASIRFSGQGRSITVTDQEVLAAFEEAVRRRSTDARTGLAYEVDIAFMSGVKVSTGFYIHDDGDGITIANDYNKHAGDPEYIGIRFAKPINKKLLSLLTSLLKK